MSFRLRLSPAAKAARLREAEAPEPRREGLRLPRGQHAKAPAETAALPRQKADRRARRAASHPAAEARANRPVLRGVLLQDRRAEKPPVLLRRVHRRKVLLPQRAAVH